MGMPTLANPIDKIDTREEVSKTAKVSQRATAKMLGVSDTTIIRDLNLECGRKGRQLLILRGVKLTVSEN